ncbi:MAG: TolC family protein [Thiotrichales bacterium]|nr:TolC family protein [Thiotrichales bacterium]
MPRFLFMQKPLPWLFALWFSPFVQAETLPEAPGPFPISSQMPSEPLPNPLSLEFLLQDFPLKSSRYFFAQTQSDLAEAQAQSLSATNGLKLNFEGRLSRREYSDEAQDHHQFALHLGKVLYDGKINQLRQLNLLKVAEAQKLEQAAELESYKLSVMQAFFAALLADFQYRIDNEAMAVEFIAFDKSKEQHSLSRLSDVDLLEAENRYQQTLLKRAKAEQNLLKMRVRLANVIGYAEARPDKLVFPDLSHFDQRSIEELKLESLQQQVEANPMLVALRSQAEGQMQQIEASHRLNQPQVRADAWVGKLSSYPELREGRWRADLSVEVPLYDAGVQRLETAKERAKFKTLQATYEQLAQSLRDEVTELYFQLQMLENERKADLLFADFADLYLDFSRALYENESSTDLGDSMVRLSQANFNQAEWQLRRAMLWSQLDYLLGVPVRPFAQPIEAQQANLPQQP